MKATNHPSDKMTIKNNNGDLLLEIDAEGVEEIKFKNGSKYTGAEIDAAVAKAGDATKVVANPTLAGTEAPLVGLQVGETKYAIPAGGGDDIFIVKVTETGGVYSADKTYTEIKNAITDGKMPIMYALDNPVPLLFGGENNGNLTFLWTPVQVSQTSAFCIIASAVMASDNTITTGSSMVSWTVTVVS